MRAKLSFAGDSQDSAIRASQKKPFRIMSGRSWPVAGRNIRCSSIDELLLAAFCPSRGRIIGHLSDRFWEKRTFGAFNIIL